MDWLAGKSLATLLGETQARVKREPAESKHRVFLFQLLAVLGQWDRALNQLNVIGQMEASALPMVHTYRQALQCEGLRASVFAGERRPLVFGEPQRWMALCLEALRLDAQDALQEAKHVAHHCWDGHRRPETDRRNQK